MKDIYFPLRKKRDELVRFSYLSNKRGASYDNDDLLMVDIIRGGIKPNDPRLQ